MRHLSKLVLLLIFLLGSYPVLASPDRLEALKKALRQEHQDTARIRIYLQLSESLKEDVNQSQRYADSAITIARTKNDSVSIAKSYNTVARNLLFVGDFDGAHDNATLALNHLPTQAKNGLEEANIFIALGDANNRLSEYPKAISCYLKARKIASNRRNSEMIAHVDNNIGVAYWHSGQLDMALDAYQNAVDYFETQKDTAAICLAYSNIAAIYEDLNRPNQQLKVLNKILGLSANKAGLKSWAYKELGSFYLTQHDTVQATYYYELVPPLVSQMDDKQQVYETYSDLARFYNRLGDRNKAFQFYYSALVDLPTRSSPKAAAVHHALAELYTADSLSDSVVYHAEKAFSIAFESGDHQTLALVSQMLAKHYQQEGNVQKAINYAIMSFDNASGKNPILARDVANLLGVLYESAGNYTKSEFYMKTYHTLADSIRFNENNRKTRIWSSQLKYEKREAELNSRIELQQQRLKLFRVLATLLGCVLLMAIWIAVTSRRLAKVRKRTNVQLQEQKDELERTYLELERYQVQLEQLVDERTIELKSALAKAQESDRFKAALLSNLSHEIRTPLNAITGLLQFIDDPSLPANARTEMVEQIQFNSVQLLSMVNDIIMLSEIDSGSFIIHPEKTNISQLLNSVLTDAQRIARYYKKEKLLITIQSQIMESQQILDIDGEHVKKILLHLVDNAIKFTQSGYIRLGFKTAEDADAPIIFFVEDSGVGIVSEHLPLVFERFWKNGEVYIQDYRGLGIGLSLCRELARLMGGTISVESAPGKGSVFSLILPSSSLLTIHQPPFVAN